MNIKKHISPKMPKQNKKDKNMKWIKLPMRFSIGLLKFEPQMEKNYIKSLKKENGKKGQRKNPASRKNCVKS